MLAGSFFPTHCVIDNFYYGLLLTTTDYDGACGGDDDDDGGEGGGKRRLVGGRGTGKSGSREADVFFEPPGRFTSGPCSLMWNPSSCLEDLVLIYLYVH